jgi:septation ring formation regulator EzrA
MDLKGMLNEAEKLAKEHPEQVDKAIDEASAEIEKHTPDNVDKLVDAAAQKAKEQI